MLRIPDSVVHPSAAAVDQGHFLGRVELRNCAGPHAHKEAQILVRGTGHVRVEKWRMFWIVNGCQHVRVHVVDRFSFEYRLREALWNLVPVANFVLPMFEGRRCFGWRIGLVDGYSRELLIDPAAETKYRSGEVFFSDLASAPPNHLLRIEPPHGLQHKMSLSDKNGAGHVSVDRGQEGNRPGFQLEGSYIHGHGKVLTAERCPQPGPAQLLIERIGIRERQALF